MIFNQQQPPLTPVSSETKKLLAVRCLGCGIIFMRPEDYAMHFSSKGCSMQTPVPTKRAVISHD
jgi:uncharacterized OB-fold protein